MPSLIWRYFNEALTQAYWDNPNHLIRVVAERLDLPVCISAQYRVTPALAQLLTGR